MTPLEKLREIAARRTPGKWEPGYMCESGAQACGPHHNWDEKHNAVDLAELDAVFIAQAANTYDLLLDVVEAAQVAMRSTINIPDIFLYTYPKKIIWPEGDKLKEALAALTDQVSETPAVGREEK